MEYAYTPYQKKTHKESGFKIPRISFPGSIGKWLAALAGIIVLLFLLFYLMLGELRFFVNHYFGLTFISKNYVILLQNDYELRPGGGFITGYGTVDTLLGIPKNINFHNSYEIDTAQYVTPPYPHEELLKNEWYEGYSFRDANWNPDFEKAAIELIDFYKQKFPKAEVDGLIVVNFSLIENLIDELGGVELDGKMLTKENLFSELEFEVNNIDRHNVEALTARKNILADLSVLLRKKIKRHPFKAKRVLVKALHEKDLYIWLKDRNLQQKVIKKGWANAMKLPERSDFLAVNLANLGSKKADRYLQTQVHYYANLTKELPEITAEVTIRFPGFTNEFSDNYKGYLRLYVPKNAEVTEMPVDSKRESLDDFEVIGTQVILPAGSKMTLTYIYTLPRTTFLHGEYKLRLIKQSGSEMFYNVTVEAKNGSTMNSKNMVTRENRATYQGQLSGDLNLELAISPDALSPYPIEQEFVSLDLINIVWNEPMEEAGSVDQANYAVIDLNKNNAEVTDEIKVASAELIRPNLIQLKLEGVTEQHEEHYQITLQNLKDLSGNFAIPNPKIITAVQRLNPPSEVPEIKLGEIPVVDENEEQPAGE